MYTRDETLQERSQKRIEGFVSELFSYVLFDLSPVGQALYARSVASDKSCDITVQELLNQHEMRQKLASIAWVIMPEMSESEYFEFIQEVVDTVVESEKESREREYQRETQNNRICTCIHPQ